MEYLIIGFVAFIASLLSFFSGFGLGTLLLPAFAVFFPVDIAISLTAIVHFLNNIVKFLLTGKKVNRQVYLRFGLSAIPAAFVGAFLLVYLTGLQREIPLEIMGLHITIIPVNAVIGAIMIIFAWMDLNKNFNRLSIPKNKLWLGGILSGFFGGLSGHQGALRSAFLINFGLSKESFVATGIAIALTVDLVRMSIYTTKYTQSAITDHISILLVALLTAFSGAIFGRVLLKKITIQIIRSIVALLLIVVGIGLITGLI